MAHFILMQLPWWLLVLWTCYSLLVVFAPRSSVRLYNYYVFVSIPNVFVTLGIFGTFTGIVYGLQGFDESNVQGSLSVMIVGLKTAFFTSIYGISLSLIMRKPVAWRVATGTVKEPKTDQENILVALSLNVVEIRKLIQGHMEEQAKAGQVRATAHSQLTRLLAKNAADTQQRIDDMASRLADANSAALVGALQDVITDFNRTFQSYIGELVEKNFDKLAEAVDQLVQWQQHYREDILIIRSSAAEMLQKFNAMVEHGERWVETMDAVAGSGSALQQVVDEFNIAFQDNSKFRLTLENIHAATKELAHGATHLKDLGQRFDGAAQAFNRTQEHVDKWSGSAEKVADMVTDLQGTLVQLRMFDIAQIPKLEESFVKRMEQTLRSFDDLMANYIKYLENRR